MLAAGYLIGELEVGLSRSEQPKSRRGGEEYGVTLEESESGSRVSTLELTAQESRAEDDREMPVELLLEEQQLQIYMTSGLPTTNEATNKS